MPGPVLDFPWEEAMLSLCLLFLWFYFFIIIFFPSPIACTLHPPLSRACRIEAVREEPG